MQECNLHSDTITLFNRQASENGDIWHASVIEGVHLTVDKAALRAKYGAEAQDNAAVSVPFTVENGRRMISGKKWLPPRRWEGNGNTLTFTVGNAFDFFVTGVWEGPETVSDEDYSADTGFYNYMARTRDDVFALTSVGGPYNLIPHFEILGR